MKKPRCCSKKTTAKQDAHQLSLYRELIELEDKYASDLSAREYFPAVASYIAQRYVQYMDGDVRMAWSDVLEVMIPLTPEVERPVCSNQKATQ